MKLFNLFILGILLVSCTSQQEPKNAASSKTTKEDTTSSIVVEDKNDPSIDSALLLTDLVNVQTLNPS
ncbi:MAG: hypothetical protein NWR50_05425, partial [Crocinitomicaceae bacterium]|nr:hypothetical protein [Crocinitomicaceae bacterium]